MAEDLREYGVTVNMLLSGGATVTGMIPEEVKRDLEGNSQLLKPEIMAKPIVYLASEQSEGLTGERLVATEFDSWLKNRNQ
ncbi:hypothetical protein AWM70_16225 [Paenibacillus yonginensis]|uniref:Uncharacterized protein n=1 Tax=Paenibacillus yonginensis TaxID=1462996 RepID=A0A1B1N3D9_9BACL|nr:hypothetical protein [Paenibacillus yonginensis]ANS75940.1 hypothetical protein AWM70_16225 [Paenibacillus yonginensis]